MHCQQQTEKVWRTNWKLFKKKKKKTEESEIFVCLFLVSLLKKRATFPLWLPVRLCSIFLVLCVSSLYLLEVCIDIWTWYAAITELVLEVFGLAG